jgi:hypothetical protein
MTAKTAMPAHAGPRPANRAVKRVVGKKKTKGKLVPQSGLNAMRTSEAATAAAMPTP